MFGEDYFKAVERAQRKKYEELYSLIEDYFNNCDKYGLSKREGQFDMALSIFEAIESRDNLVIEAGVGIGKSFAYLIPLLYYYKMFNKSFIISTSTIALQEQLEKDINLLSEQLDIPVEIVIAKGMNNFICLNRLEDFLNKKENEEYKQFFKTKKQDRKDYPNIKDNIWNQVNVENCLYSKCATCSKCEFYKRRMLMKSVNGVIICNHDLLIQDIEKKNNFYDKTLFRDVNFIVCDEAHNLENKVRNAYTKEIKLNQIKDTIKVAIQTLARFNNYKYDYNKIEILINKLSQKINSNVDIVINELKAHNIEVDDCNGLEFRFDDDILFLSQKISDILGGMLNSIQIFSYNGTEEVEELLENHILALTLLKNGSESNYLFWIERIKNKNHIYYSPKRIDKISHRLFFNSNNTFIFTSATLSIGKNNFNYFLNNIGANSEEDNLTVENSYDSPYDYDNNAIVYCCDEIANPKDKKQYLTDLVNKIKELILLTHGKTLVLFTSKSDMNYVYEKVGDKIDDIEIYIQNDGSSQNIVKEKFKENINSVLFSTGIFWEGIDIKGLALSNLIIARLPFPVVDPVMEYKKSKYGKLGFEKVYIPEMIIKLKQGVGRLIRSETDKGVVCILDSRLPKYENKVKEAIPIKKFVYSIEEVEKFVKKNEINKEKSIYTI